MYLLFNFVLYCILHHRPVRWWFNYPSLRCQIWLFIVLIKFSTTTLFLLCSIGETQYMPYKLIWWKPTAVLSPLSSQEIYDPTLCFGLHCLKICIVFWLFPASCSFPHSQSKSFGLLGRLRNGLVENINRNLKWRAK